MDELSTTFPSNTRHRQLEIVPDFALRTFDDANDRFDMGIDRDRDRRRCRW